MLEVYFNVIEFGPNVYGIGEASQYYFGKIPAELTLKECLFLATIIPKPKGFMYRFDENHQLKSFAKEQSNFLTKVMLRRNLITETDTIGVTSPLEIIGEAKNRLKVKQNTTTIDSLQVDDFEF
jgi:membrane peptidoglycan carboxypeptidase